MTANINNTTRKAVYRRDGFMCALCGDNRNLQIHHCVHRSQGGGNSPHNLITLCWRCHALAHGTNLYDCPDMTQEDAEQAIVEYLADYYLEDWNPRGERG